MELILRYIELLELCHSDSYDPFLADMELRCLEEIGILLRYNHNHDPHTGRFTSGNGVDKSGKSGIIEEEIKNGSVILEINHEKQGRHLLGDGYIKGRSYFTISEDELDQIIKSKYGTGELKFDTKTGKWKHKEIIVVDDDIGICIDRNGNESPTNRFTTHYSKTGIHLVPAKKVRKNK